MNVDFNSLKENLTLAPLEKLEEYYNPRNLNQKDAGILAAISKSSVSAIESAIGSLTHLISNLRIYKECMIDSINLQAESADIATKYTGDVPQQVNILPGVLSMPQTYDLTQIRTDNERMMAIKDQKDKAISQKDIYLRVAKEDVRLFIAAWKRLNISNASFDEFIDSLAKQIYGNTKGK